MQGGRLGRGSERAREGGKAGESVKDGRAQPTGRLVTGFLSGANILVLRFINYYY